MSIENKIPVGDNVFDDIAGLEVSLADIFIEGVHGVYDEPAKKAGVTNIEPISSFAPPATDTLLVISDNWLSFEHGVLVKPESFHYLCDEDQTSDYNERAKKIIEIAAEHYQKIRELGMKVVGHTFEAADVEDQRLVNHPDYPTIFVGAKFPTPERPNDNFTDDNYSIGRIKLDTIDPDVLLAKITGPVEAYMHWCGETSQHYMLYNILSLSNYAYHGGINETYLQDITSRMNVNENGSAWLPKFYLDRFMTSLDRARSES